MSVPLNPNVLRFLRPDPLLPAGCRSILGGGSPVPSVCVSFAQPRTVEKKESLLRMVENELQSGLDVWLSSNADRKVAGRSVDRVGPGLETIRTDATPAFLRVSNGFSCPLLPSCDRICK
ncbi:uncharacterized protein ACOB8E_012300 isoform 1-T2 [Sarcophilus harrisii]